MSRTLYEVGGFKTIEILCVFLHIPHMSRTRQIEVPAPPPETPVIVAAFYKFVPLNDYQTIQPTLQAHCKKNNLLGTILLAAEGINGTVCGTQNDIQALMDCFAQNPRFADITPKFSFAADANFHRMKVRLKNEIVAMGQPNIDPIADVGHYVKPQDWNDLISQPDTLLIDTRNAYEVAIGSFDGALNPKTKSFRDFPKWVDSYLANLKHGDRPKNIAMFCTGGIRCEKATAYLVGQGFENVFHLEGGILKYLETTPPEQSAWNGDCFVFDQRVSVRHGLGEGDFDMCHACRMPLTESEKTHESFEAGVSCHHCIDTHSDADRLRFRERQKQIRLARQRGENHIGQSTGEK